MPVFIKDNMYVLYLHVPKTGGSTIVSFFKRNGFDIKYLDTGEPGTINKVTHCSPQHLHCADLARIFDFSKFSFIFTTVRNPMNRMKSEYLMRNRGRVKMGFDDWVDDTLKKYGENNYLFDNHIRPQSAYYLESAIIYRQEDRYDDVWAEDIAERIGFPLIARVQSSLVRKKIDNVTVDDVVPEPSTADRIREFYKEDFALFEYA
ncbi:MAG: sulfotransferase family 2 domain-containing protein [Pseudodesulfovibrio sp.]|uniref:Sulfotransferase family protein n=1 Tax=Pseudodesulfovibrio indicus TaxID=1716143 RepID=A0A126QKB0_9BACT|nr:sulfotransferase family 2 domain-containing protein [Pseudodesulfovibrio indicus]AMK10068.1 hypothetical protein AWY79_02525 [Pseudodesulfovibrio indicus]TDT86963.1 sulfotransferase family protein [Pseudodesulfovibrio indicus]